LEKDKSIVIALSGGLDSTTLLAYYQTIGFEVMCYGFTYGSKHNLYENHAASKIAQYYKVPYELIDITDAMKLMQSNLMKGQGEIPEGHYESESMKSTVVPGRNMIFLSLLAGLAWSYQSHGFSRLFSHRKTRAN